MIKAMITVFFGLIVLFFVPALACSAAATDGMILLDVERNGEAWYVYPEDAKRYYLGRPADAFSIMRRLGLGISEADFQKIASDQMLVDGDLALARRLSGKIVIQTEKNGEAWYIYPRDLKKYYLGRPADAFSIMRRLGLGITREDLAKIHKPGTQESLNSFSRYEHQRIKTLAGEFSLDLVVIDLANPKLKIITDAASPYPTPEKKSGSFGAQSLGKFVLENKGFAGINGTYFEAYNQNRNYFFYPIYDTPEGKLVNEDQLKYWTTGPIMAFDEKNQFYYFKDSREFKSVAEFEAKYATKLRAALGNRPRLIEEGMNQLIEWDIDDKQLLTKADRNALGYSGGKLYLAVAHNATLPELADIMKALKVDYALNLDGGYSSALWYGDEYMVKPGRDIPNAIIFSEE